MQAPYGSRFSINERLHAEADSIYAVLQKRVEDLRSQRSRSAFNRDFRVSRDRKLGPHGIKNPVELIGFENGRSASAEIDRIDLPFDLPAHFRSDPVCPFDIHTHAIDVFLENCSREHI